MELLVVFMDICFGVLYLLTDFLDVIQKKHDLAFLIMVQTVK
jgi:hypothetical protein